MSTNPHQDVHAAWLNRVRTWLDAAHGNQQRLARALGVDRRRVSAWFNVHHPGLPAWAVAPVARLTGCEPHTDFLKPITRA
jgi:hypothetical protein